MSKPTHNIIYKARSYETDAGEVKFAYGAIGAAWSDEDGAVSRIKLDSVPVNWDGFLYLRTRDELPQ
ncbi:hypothetical protein [Thalassococcus sp. S3]|uniref:hypothetical protein n=1 Tax=Thalassococcus sp. S3 TaxID=2017482 RepID=UPI00102C7A67|nr:hypothetical protein [Thalassococcus sp. S3]